MTEVNRDACFCNDEKSYLKTKTNKRSLKGMLWVNSYYILGHNLEAENVIIKVRESEVIFC